MRTVKAYIQHGDRHYINPCHIPFYSRSGHPDPPCFRLPVVLSLSRHLGLLGSRRDWLRQLKAPGPALHLLHQARSNQYHPSLGAEFSPGQQHRQDLGFA